MLSQHHSEGLIDLVNLGRKAGCSIGSSSVLQMSTEAASNSDLIDGERLDCVASLDAFATDTKQLKNLRTDKALEL